MMVGGFGGAEFGLANKVKRYKEIMQKLLHGEKLNESDFAFLADEGLTPKAP